ncbi:MAG: hypothetical protein JNL83_20440 [Myxococcales bacterium]|nr:hypothetical protein [Myxococcales bacterium]
MVAVFVAGKAARDAILLSEFGIGYLPLFIGIASVVAFPVIVIAGKLMARFGPVKLVPIANLVSAAMLVAEWVLLEQFPRAMAALVFVHLSTASAVLVSGFWSIVNERFDVQTAKRHIGRIGMGATLGGIAGGIVAERTAVYLPSDMVLLVLAVLQVVCAVALYSFGSGVKHVRETQVDQSTEALKHAAKAPLIRTVAIIVVLVSIAGGVLDYVFKADIVNAGDDSLLRSLAVFYTVTNVITAVVQLALCGPLIAKLGVPRSVSALPATLTGFSLFALLVPIPLSAAIARSAELVTRNSIYRSAYELLYAPLTEERKRPTKVILDVGADKIGDILGAQLVAAVVWFSIDTRFALLLAAVACFALTLLVSLRLPRAYTQALEESLLDRAAEVAHVEAEPEPWLSLSGLPSHAESVPLRLRRSWRRAKVRATPRPSRGPDPLIELARELRSRDPAKVKAALAQPLTREAAPLVIDLVGDDRVAAEAVAALAPVARDITGLLADALLDQRRSEVLRRRLPAVIAQGEPQLAAWALWRALGDPSFDVRYRAGAMLSRLAADGHLKELTVEQVFEAVRRELVADPREWRTRQLVDDLVGATQAGEEEVRGPTSLEHVFRVLGLVLPAEPLRIALHAMQTDDPSLRGTALEYLESILPPDVRAQLWPLLENGEAPATPAEAVEAVTQAEAAASSSGQIQMPAARIASTKDELIERLKTSYPDVLARLRMKMSPSSSGNGR